MNTQQVNLRAKERRDKDSKQHRTEILEAAEELFSALGMDAVSMEDVAEKALLSRRTLYRYFPTKENLAGALQVRALERLASLFAAAEAAAAPSGRDRIWALGVAFGRFGFEEPSTFRSLRLCRSPESTVIQPGSQWEGIIELNQTLEKQMSRILREGMDDGSLREDLDPEVTTAYIMGSTSGILETMLDLGERFAAIYGRPSAEVWQAGLDLIIRGVEK